MVTMNRMKEKVRGMKENPIYRMILYIIILLVLFFTIVTQSLAIVRYRYEIADLNEIIVDTKNQTKVLEERIEKISTDKYIEEMARERLGMTKSGEIPIKIMEEEQELYEKKVLGSQEKIGIYMKDWYIDLEEWVETMKKK